MLKSTLAAVAAVLALLSLPQHWQQKVTRMSC